MTFIILLLQVSMERKSVDGDGNHCKNVDGDDDMGDDAGTRVTDDADGEDADHSTY